MTGSAARVTLSGPKKVVSTCAGDEPHLLVDHALTSSWLPDATRRYCPVPPLQVLSSGRYCGSVWLRQATSDCRGWDLWRGRPGRGHSRGSLLVGPADN